MEKKQTNQDEMTVREVEGVAALSRQQNNSWLVIRYIIPSVFLLLPSLVLLSYNWVASGLFFFAFWMLVILLAVREDDRHIARLRKKFGRPLTDQEMGWVKQEFQEEEK